MPCLHGELILDLHIAVAHFPRVIRKYHTDGSNPGAEDRGLAEAMLEVLRPGRTDKYVIVCLTQGHDIGQLQRIT